MLKDGKFIREEPPKIGRFYIPKLKEDEHTPEERFAQDLLLGSKQERISFLSKFFGYMLRV
jgi:hypothetical protein